MSYPPVGCNFGVYVTAFALVEIYFSLKDVDLFGLHFEFLLEVFLEFLHLSLLFVVFINEDCFVGAVKFAVQLKLLFSKSADQVKQISVLLNALGKVTLRLLEVGFFLFDVADAFLFGLVELVLLIENCL